jgi:WD40 repeat protein
MAEIRSHNKPIVAALYNKPFKYVVSACQDSVISVWDLYSGEKIIQTVNAHVRRERGVEYPVDTENIFLVSSFPVYAKFFVLAVDVNMYQSRPSCCKYFIVNVNNSCNIVPVGRIKCLITVSVVEVPNFYTPIFCTRNDTYYNPVLQTLIIATNQLAVLEKQEEEKHMAEIRSHNKPIVNSFRC